MQYLERKPDSTCVWRVLNLAMIVTVLCGLYLGMELRSFAGWFWAGVIITSAVCVRSWFAHHRKAAAQSVMVLSSDHGATQADSIETEKSHSDVEPEWPFPIDNKPWEIVKMELAVLSDDWGEKKDTMPPVTNTTPPLIHCVKHKAGPCPDWKERQLDRRPEKTHFMIETDLPVAMEMPQPITSTSHSAVLYGFPNARYRTLSAQATAAGWQVKGILDRTVDYLVADPQCTGLIVTKAEALGVQIIDEARFLQLLDVNREAAGIR